MTYNITSTSGLQTYTVTNGAINTQTNLSFIGKGTLNYGSNLNTNFLKLLENFAWDTAPDKPVAGQLWWDTSTNNLRVYDGASFGIVSPPLDRITSSIIGNLEIASSSITGEITNGNINIGPNGTGNTVINRLAILNTGVGKVPYTAANGMIVTGVLAFNSTDSTLTSGNLSATYIAGTLTTGPQSAITSVGTLDNLTVTGNITAGQIIGYHTGAIGANVANSGAFTTIAASSTAAITGNVTVGNLMASGEGGQVQGYLTGAIGANVANTGVFTSMIGNSFSLSSSSSSTLFTVTGSSTNGGLRANLIATGTGGSAVPLLIFSRTSTSTNGLNGGLGWIKTLTDGSTTTSSIYVGGTNNASAPTTQMQFTSPNGFSFTGTLLTGATTIDTNGNVGIGTTSPTSALHVVGNITGYFNGPIGANTANTGAFTTLTTTSTANVGNLITTDGVYWANGSAFTSSAGATGGSTDKAFWENDTTITTSYSITAGKNAGTFGPVTINSGATVTIPSGSVWSIV